MRVEVFVRFFDQSFDISGIHSIVILTDIGRSLDFLASVSILSRDLTDKKHLL